MKEIIKKNGEVRIQWTCQYCGCIFTCDSEDETVRESAIEGVIWAREVSTICPECKKKIGDNFLPKSKRITL